MGVCAARSDGRSTSKACHGPRVPAHLIVAVLGGSRDRIRRRCGVVGVRGHAPRASAVATSVVLRETPQVDLGSRGYPGYVDTLSSRWEYDEAEAPCLRALSILEPAAGRDHSEVARVLCDLAAVYLERGDYVRAERTYRRSARLLAQRPRRAGSEPWQLRATLGLANVERARGRYDKAERRFRRALRLAEEVFGAKGSRSRRC